MRRLNGWGGEMEYTDKQALEERADKIATEVAERCHGDRKPGQAPARYAVIWQAARLGVLAALRQKDGDA